MARPKVQENRQALILEAAEQLFARYGYERTSMDDIARHLNIGKGSIYLDFRTKEDILFMLLNKHVEAVLNMMKNKVEQRQGSPLLALREMLELAISAVYDTATRDMHTPEEMLHCSFSIRKRFSHFFAQHRFFVLELLKQAVEAGEIAPEKASEEMAVSLMMATASFFPPYLSNYCEFDERISRDDLIARSSLVLDLLISGLRASAAGATEDCRTPKPK
jgi:AcrR family transcriptional regulator